MATAANIEDANVEGGHPKPIYERAQGSVQQELETGAA